MKTNRLYSNTLEILRRLRGKPSKYILPFNVGPGTKIVLWCRVSGKNQRYNENPEDQRKDMQQRYCDPHGGEVAGAVLHTGTGMLERHDFDPGPLLEAVRLTKQHGAILLAESTGRFVRNSAYSKKRQNVQADADDLERLVEWTDGVQLMTVVHPDASPRQVRSHERKRGQRQKNHPGGRPRKTTPGYKKLRREMELGWVLFVHRQGRRGYGWIAADTGLAKSTVRDWIRTWA